MHPYRLLVNGYKSLTMYGSSKPMLTEPLVYMLVTLCHAVNLKGVPDPGFSSQKLILNSLFVSIQLNNKTKSVTFQYERAPGYASHYSWRSCRDWGRRCSSTF